MRNEDLFHSFQAEFVVSLIHRIWNSVSQHQEHIARCEGKAGARVIASWYQTQRTVPWSAAPYRAVSR